MNSIEAIKERLKVNLEKLKTAIVTIIILTGGLLTLLLNGLVNSITITIFVVGAIFYLFLVFYMIISNIRIENLLKIIGDKMIEIIGLCIA